MVSTPFTHVIGNMADDIVIVTSKSSSSIGFSVSVDALFPFRESANTKRMEDRGMSNQYIKLLD